MKQLDLDSVYIEIIELSTTLVYRKKITSPACWFSKRSINFLIAASLISKPLVL